jgi:hypothetical protein
MNKTPIEHPGAWKGADFHSKDDFAVDLERRHIVALDDAISLAYKRGGWRNLAHADAPLGAIADDVARWRHEIADGRGLLLLRGLPVERWSVAETEAAFWALGLHLGHAVSQSPIGDRLGRVEDVSRPNVEERGYKSRKELSPHTDSDDIVGLLCIRQAKAGGFSVLVSAMMLWNEILARRPEYLASLERGFHYHWFGEEPPGEPEITSYRVPVFGWEQGKVSVCYLREFMDWAAKDPRYAYAGDDQAALDLFQSLCDDPDIRLLFRYEPGELVLFNNYTTLHARTAYEDETDPAKKRLLLRLWLQTDPPRPIHPNLRRYYGQDGIVVQPGRTATYYQGKAQHETAAVPAE